MKRRIILAALAVTPCLGGPLTPPPGPIASTMKTIAEAEPRTAINATNTPGDADSLYKITLPGSYYLTGNVLGVSGKHGIEIAGSGVTIDLMGFTLDGDTRNGSPVTHHGITTAAGSSGLTIRNGTVTNWATGVDANSLGSGEAALIEGVHALNNTGRGFWLGKGGVIRNCTAVGNGGNGIHASKGFIIESCVCRSNGDYGIYAANQCQVTRCVSSENAGTGIFAANGIISECISSSNGNHGIQVANTCRVVSNTCTHNGVTAAAGSGIHAVSGRNRIEHNNCLQNDIGMHIDFTGNFIIGNTCGSNSTVNWDVNSGNVCYIVTATTSAFISGDSGGVSPGSANPNANFTY